MIKYDGQLTKILVDGATNATFRFHFRRPTAAEQLAFDRKTAKGRLKSASLRVRKVAAELVKPLISGISFPEPELALGWKMGEEYVVLSAKPGEPGYREDWLAVIDGFNPNLLRLLGLKVFAGENFDEEDEEEAQEAVPN